MPFEANESKEGFCPYCINGVLAYDKYSDNVYCMVCNKIVKIRYWKDREIRPITTKWKFSKKQPDKIKIIKEYKKHTGGR